MARKLIKTDGCYGSTSVSPPGILSEDLIREILKRLPARSLMRFKCVSKDWMRLIRDPLFAEVHLSNSYARPEASYILFLGCSEGVLATDQKLVPRNSLVPAGRDLFCTHKPCSNIVNGLICLRSRTRVMIYNLSTGEKRNLPRTRIRDYDTTFAFGFDPVSKKYKVLLLRGHRDCEILTVDKILTWQDLLDVPKINPYHGFRKLNPIHFGGRIYFIERDASNQLFIRFFNLSSEKFGSIDPPSKFQAHYPAPSLVEAGGNLVVLTRDTSWQQPRRGTGYPHNIWVLDLKWVERGTLWFEYEKIWGSIGRGEILLSSYDICLFDPKTSSWRKEKINNPRDFRAYTHISCNHVENILPLSSLD